MSGVRRTSNTPPLHHSNNPIPNNPTTTIWRFTDGKAGHENQSLALVENLQRLASFESHEIPVSDREHAEAAAPHPPRLVLGAGHRTHLPLLLAARRFDCPSVVLMKPSIPAAFFDLCLIPAHDLTAPPAPNVVPTRGMLNRLPVDPGPKSDRGLILVGGPSKHHGWNAEALRDDIARIVTTRTALDWHLTNSRRTPDDFLEILNGLPLTLHPWQDTPPGWLPAQLQAAPEVWVTEDSMSMIYEALTAQARVGLLAMPRKARRSRIVRGIDRLVASGWTRFLGDDAAAELPAPPERLHEASRCARELIARFFPALA